MDGEVLARMMIAAFVPVAGPDRGHGTKGQPAPEGIPAPANGAYRIAPLAAAITSFARAIAWSDAV